MADSIARHFAGLADPRSTQGRRHVLTDLIALTVMAVVSGCDSFTEVEDFGKAKLSWLKTFLHLPHGIPSHDTLGRVFAALDPHALECCLMEWSASLARTSKGRLIAIDGKTLRRSFDRAGRKAAIHLVNAWCNANRLVLGQLATDAKSNEITAIPRLLELLDLKQKLGFDDPRFHVENCDLCGNSAFRDGYKEKLPQSCAFEPAPSYPGYLQPASSASPAGNGQAVSEALVQAITDQVLAAMKAG